MNFSNVLPKLKMAFSTTFNLVSKCSSGPVTDTAGAGFTPTIPDAKEITVVVILEEEVRVARVLPLTVLIESTSWLFIGEK